MLIHRTRLRFREAHIAFAASSMLLFAAACAPTYDRSYGNTGNYPSYGNNAGVHVGSYPSLVRVPGYPVYYEPRLGWNYFFFDGLYWVYAEDNWYASDWYDGPWQYVRPQYVPVYILRVPVRYYRNPPMYFLGWRGDVAPRWGDHWGPAWQQQRPGW